MFLSSGFRPSVISSQLPWISLLIVVGGVSLVGYSGSLVSEIVKAPTFYSPVDMVESPNNEPQLGLVLVGVFVILFAQVFTAIQCVVEAFNVLSLPLQASDSRSPTSLSLGTGVSASSDVLHHPVPDASAAHTHDTLAIKMHTDLLEKQLQKRQAGLIKVVVKGISKLISKIIQKVKAKRLEKKEKAEITKSVVQQGRHDHPQFNWVVCHHKHLADFKGKKGVDWDHDERSFNVNGKTVKYDVYYAREGEFYNKGGKGPVDWAYDGFYDVDHKSKGKHITFKRPPGT
ncbi:hypothetical protein C0995_005591 [Termitomyces sp. Mi166|nr:hypothetical protein C0995_005591 [Termitomyces sp. Mi166\